ncbi:MAG: chorismate-binding protein, partial [Giesbergeria sp.]
AGELYQVNYTAPLTGALQGSAAALFAALQRAQPGGYAAHIDAGGEQVLSVSPELFFDWREAPGGGDILARPMKGTAARGATPEEDTAQADHLRTAPKERAENVMIVDLLRNDLSRIALPHSVQVPALFATQALPTVWQMTSDVTARTRPGTTLTDVFAALFPCGSVTGAPKVRAMQMVRTLEPAPRGVYCGAVGVVRPGEQGGIRATFNVPIRTVVLQGDLARCGIGSGITADAVADAEWNEWRHKRAFVERASAPFDLLETLALTDGKFDHADLHLARMGEAAAHFGFAWNLHATRQELQIAALQRHTGAWRVRLLLSKDGSARAETFALQPTPTPVFLQLARQPLREAAGEFCRYKTTRRAHYDAFAPSQPGVFDTILYNEAGEITECTRGNVAMWLDGRWVTPPLSCGLLPGVGRAAALREGRVHEAVVRLESVPRVQAWAFINSLRGWLDAEIAL